MNSEKGDRVRGLSHGELRARVLGAWAEVLPGAKTDESFFDQGGGSLSAVLLVARLEERVGVSVPFATLVASQSVDDIVAWIAARAR